MRRTLVPYNFITWSSISLRLRPNIFASSPGISSSSKQPMTSSVQWTARCGTPCVVVAGAEVREEGEALHDLLAERPAAVGHLALALALDHPPIMGVYVVHGSVVQQHERPGRRRHSSSIGQTKLCFLFFFWTGVIDSSYVD
jgi:hypothetical protein